MTQDRGFHDRNGNFDVQDDGYSMRGNGPQNAQGFSSQSVQGVQGYPPRNEVDPRRFPPAGGPNMQGFPLAQNPQGFESPPQPMNGLQNFPLVGTSTGSVQGYPSGSQSVPGIPRPGVQSMPGFPPRGPRNMQGISPTPSTIRGPPPFDRRFWRPPVHGLIASLKGSPSARNTRLPRTVHAKFVPGDVTLVQPCPEAFYYASDDDLFFSKQELQYRRVQNENEMNTHDAELFDTECEAVYERIFQQVEAFYGDRHREPITKYGVFSFSKDQLRSLLTPQIMMGIKCGLRGSELGGLKGRRDRTVLILEAVRGWHAECEHKRKKQARRNRLNFDVGMSLATEEVSVVDRLWSQVIALGEEIVENSV